MGMFSCPVGGAIVNVAYMRGYHSAKDALQTRELFKTLFQQPFWIIPLAVRAY